MGITDAPQQLTLTDVYPEGTPFVMKQAWVEGVVPTQFGDRSMAKAIIEPVGGGQAQEFALWGSLCEQIQQIEEGDLPGIFAVKKDGRRWLFVAAVPDVDAALPPATQSTQPGAAEAAEAARTAAQSGLTPDEEGLGVEPRPGEGASQS